MAMASPAHGPTPWQSPGRRGGGMSLGSRKPAAAPRRAASTSTVPARAPPAAPPAPMQQQSGGMLSGIGSTIAQGMAFGTGSAIAHRAVGAVANSFGGSDDEAAAAPVQQQTMDNSQMANTQFCATDKQMFYECLQMNKGDQESCRFLYDALRDCQLNSAHM